MRRARPLLTLLLLPLAALGASGGPDAGDLVFTDSTESPGPPAQALDFDRLDATTLSLGDSGTELVALPFDFEWYGAAMSQVTVIADGGLLFSGGLGDLRCPGDGGAWSGVAAFGDDLGAGTVRVATAGRYPNRAFAVEWQSPHALVGGEGTFQAWLLEDRPEAVVELVDVTFGDASVDGGASAAVGAQGNGSTGLAWSCTGGLADGSAAWFGAQGGRPMASVRNTSNLSQAWLGANAFQYAGRSLASGDMDGDGMADVVAGNPDQSTAYVMLGGSSAGHGGALADADVVVTDPGTTGTGTTDSHLGAAVVVSDLDGDGLGDLALGAPYANGTTLTRVGAVALMAGGSVGGARSLADSDTLLVGPDTSQAYAGWALAAGDVDGDGYPDLVVGAPYHDAVAEDAGAVYVWMGGSTVLDADAALEDGLRWDGSETQDAAGTSVGVGDMDGDGAAEIVVGAPEADGGFANSGLVYVLPGGAGLASGTLFADASLVVQGEAENDRAGTALAVGDLDADGMADLVIGAPYFDDPLSAAGGAFVFINPLSLSTGAGVSLVDADRVITGGASNANAGMALALGDIDGDSVVDVIVSAPNMNAGATGGGAVAIFTDPTASPTTMGEADYGLLGDSTGGQLGMALAVSDSTADHDGDGLAELWAGAPYDDAAGTDSAGAVYGMELTPDFLDADADGFVATDAGGIDCDDGDAAVFPGAGETAGDLVDNDCDGWVDDLVVVRDLPDDWAWDLGDELGVSTPALYDFETSTVGADVSDLYLAEGLTFSAGGNVQAQTSVFGSLARGDLGAEFTPDTANQLDLVFSSPVDAAGFWMLDAQGSFLVTTYDSTGVLLDSYPLTMAADGRPGGAFVGLTFSSSVDRVRLVGPGLGGWGLDDIELAWAESTDRDGDGWTDAEGDCDDTDAAVSPDQTEVLGNGIDDNCDGVVDGGDVTVYVDSSAWELDAGILPELIDFETLAIGTAPTDEYADLGLNMDGDAVVLDDVDGSAPRDLQAVQASGDTIVLHFTETQPAASLWLLDAEGTVTLTGSLDGVDLYVAEVTTSGADLAGGVFVGLIWDLGVDTLTLTADASTLTWGLDDLSFSELGLDDADGDGLTEREGDCDDSDSSTYPGAPETWYDGVDSNCDGADDYDADGDGFELGDMGGDCDDGDASISPDAVDTWYDGVDSNCDGASDYDADADGHDDAAYGGDDCDDGDAAVSPDATEVWYDGVDSDCMGDDDYDADGDGWVPEGYGATGALGVGDCNDGDATVSPDATEAWYDGIDSDCDGASDYDVDGDGQDSDAYGGDDCDDFNADAWLGAPGEVCYDGVDTDCDGWSDNDCDRDGYDAESMGGLDCDDTDSAINPDATDTMGDGIDSNCDGAPEYDDDGDGYDGVEDGGTDCDDTDSSVYLGAPDTWYDGVDSDCAGDDDYDADLDGYDAEIAGGDDCDDTDATVHPGAVDYYYDGIDSNCDGSDDYDADGDGWAASWYGGEDCDDSDGAVSPDATEVWYDGVDSDCDGSSDYDADGDGWDSDAYGGLDCDDTDIDIRPDVAETWYDGVDSDCDGADDYDADGDGYDARAWGGDDCDDTDSATNPGVLIDACGGGDEDCDGSVDEDCGGGDTGGTDGGTTDGGADGGSDTGSTDGGTTDGGATDGGATDGGATDGGTTDGGTTDGGATDGGATDGGATDGGTTDGGATDGGATDGGATDGGTTDGGATDGGATDGGATDGGTTDAGGTTDGGTTSGSDWVTPSSGDSTDKGGCGGCATGNAGGGAWLSLLVLFGLRRRRNGPRTDREGTARLG